MEGRRNGGKREELHLLCHFISMNACNVLLLHKTDLKSRHNFHTSLFIHIKSNQFPSTVQYRAPPAEGRDLLMSVRPAGDKQVNIKWHTELIPVGGIIKRFNRKVMSFMLVWMLIKVTAPHCCYWDSCRKSDSSETTSLKEVAEMSSQMNRYLETATKHKDKTQKVTTEARRRKQTAVSEQHTNIFSLHKRRRIVS